MSSRIRGALLLILVTLLALPITVFAQDLGETFTTSDGSLTFQYPSGWVVEESFGSVLMANSQDALETNEPDLQSGQVQVSIFAGPVGEIALGMGIADGELTALGFLEELVAQSSEDDVNFPEPPTTIDAGSDAAIVMGVEENEAIVIVMISEDGQSLILLGAAAPIGESGQYRDLLINMANSITYTAPVAGAGTTVEDTGAAPVTGTGAVIWQQQRASTFDADSFGNLGEISVGADDTIYVADGFSGIRVLDADGNVLRTISNNDVSSVDDLAVLPDGSIWVADSFNQKLLLLGADGSLIKSFGEAGTGAGQFGDFIPETFELGADGNLYVFDSQKDAEENSVGRIEVFDQDGNFLREFPTDPTNFGKLRSFILMTSDDQGNLYLAESFTGITVFDSEGNVVAENLGEEAIGFSGLNAVTVAPDGSIYMATFGSILKIDAQGNLVGQFGTEQTSSDTTPPFAPGEFNYPTGIGVLSNGDVIVADSNYEHSQIVRINFESSESSGTSETSGGDVADASGSTEPTKEPVDTSGGLSGAMGGSTGASGSEVRQWAIAATASSQYGDDSWSAMQATGEPNTLECGDITTAWASSTSTGVDNLMLYYTDTVIPTQVNIYQTYNPGSITKVSLVAVDGTMIDLPNSADPLGNTLCPGVFTINIADMVQPVNGVVIYLDQTLGGSWNEIDAVELVGTAQ